MKYFMNQLILTDEMVLVKDWYDKFSTRYIHPPKLRGISKKGRFLFEHFYVITDNNPLGRYTIAAVKTLETKGLIQSTGFASVGTACEKYDSFDYTNVEEIALSDLGKHTFPEKSAFLFCVDCNASQNKAAWFTALDDFVKATAGLKRRMATVGVLMPAFPAAPGELDGLSEREFSYYMECVLKDKTPEQSFCLELEQKCRSLVVGGFSEINFVRIENLYGPDSNRIRQFDLDAFVRNAFESGVVEVTKEDHETTVALSYIRGAFNMIVRVLYVGR
ncbi:MAG: hypothetical protein MJ132_02345 [Clostridia bacterium]|nr:hypothetical protein [Clostridia bacterium]